MATVEQQRNEVNDSTIFDWRFETLLHAGYAPAEAWRLATTKEVDVRLAERLLDQGCPTSTALRILL